MFRALLPVPLILRRNNAELHEVRWVCRNGILSQPPKALILLAHLYTIKVTGHHSLVALHRMATCFRESIALRNLPYKLYLVIL